MVMSDNDKILEKMRKLEIDEDLIIKIQNIREQNFISYNRGDSMFRNSISKIDPEHFGVGSIIKAGEFSKWLLVSFKQNFVSLVNMDTFEVIPNCSFGVVDQNFLSEDEARLLIDESIGKKLQYTYTDFELDPKGLKNE